jgi:hypothetical protein
MSIKALELTSVEARRFTKRDEKVRNIRIDNNSTVTLITEINDKEANIDFRYTANYGGVGIIKIEGTLIYEGDAAALAQQWSAQANMPDEIASEIHTAVMRMCVPEATMISRDLKLPPPFPLPQINIQRKGKGKDASSSGMEVA